MKQTILLCGGPDRCAKSTILAEVGRRTGVKVFKASNCHDNFLNRQDRFISELRYADFRMVDMFRQLGTSALVDRAHLCEWSYSRFFGRPTDNVALRAVDDAFADMGARILICTRASFKGVQDDLNPRIDEAALQRLHRIYREFGHWTRCRTMYLYVDDHDLDRQVGQVLKFMER